MGQEITLVTARETDDDVAIENPAGAWLSSGLILRNVVPTIMCGEAQEIGGWQVLRGCWLGQDTGSPAHLLGVSKSYKSKTLQQSTSKCQPGQGTTAGAATRNPM